MSPTADDFIADLPTPLRKRAARVRRLVHELAPKASEKVTWDAVSMFDARRGGPIKGSICQLVHRDGVLRLDFPLGSLMEDPEGLLTATPGRKGKMYVELTAKSPTIAQITTLIRASLDEPEKPKRSGTLRPMEIHTDPVAAPRGVLFAIDESGRHLPDPFAQTPGSGWTWTHLAQASPDARAWLLKDSGIPLHAARSMLADKTRPGCVVIDQGILFIGRGVNLDPASTPEDMVTIRAWIEHRRIITVVVRRLRSAEAVAQEFGTASAPSSPSAVLARLLTQMVDRIGPVVEELGESLDEVQADVIDDSTPTVDASTLSPLRLRTVSMHRYLLPMHDASTALIDTDVLEKPTEVRVDLIATRDRLARLIEELASIDARAAVTRDEIVSRRAEELNDRVYALTILAGVFLPLSVLTGLLGMNVGGLPFLDNPNGFWITTGSMITLLVVTLAVLRLKRWI